MSKRLIKALLLLAVLGYFTYRDITLRKMLADYEHVKDDAITAVHFPERAELIRKSSQR